ncbi:hypothetical protein QFC21_004828 [Naganishia friedmannii]|uniref:Uncharacterized protein n=1 Tax=Naganishia friedmannii TaxID=89922 RepID=A0ACC2VDD3_9TREE|nr:hypothetical protein QFC21_004828 [Naganishia friedmannii]
MFFYKPKPEPSSDRHETLIPESKTNFFQRTTVGWVFPLLRTGYSRTIEENDVWSLDECRRAQALSDLLEAKFYSRCPPSRRPLHLGGVRSEIPFERYRTASARSEDLNNTPPEDCLEDGLTADAPVLDRTLSLALNVSRADMTHGCEPIRKTEECAKRKSPAASKTSLSTAIAIFAILSRLNPWSTYREAARLEKGNKVIETDEQGKKRIYDSSLMKALIRSCWQRLLVAVACKACYSVLITTSSLVMKRLINYISASHHWAKANEGDRETLSLSKPESIGYGIGIAIGLASMQEVASLFENHYSAQSMTCGTNLTLIARKSLRLSPGSRIEFTNGKQITAITADSGYVEWSFPLIVEVLVEPLTIITGFALLLVNLGPSALVGIGLLAMSSPLMAIMFKDMRESRQQQLKVMDKRVRLTSEVLSAIRQIKLYAYEAYFEKRMLGHRGQELARLRKNIRARATLSMITLFNVIQAPMSDLPMVITALADAHVAIVRISKILTAEEQPHGLIIDRQQEHGIQVSGDFTYETAAPPDHKDRGRESLSKKKIKGTKKTKEDPDSEKAVSLDADKGKENEEVPFALKGIDLHIPRGALVCIFGRIGSGKSALLEGILGEMRQTSGHVIFGGDISLVTQTPWIQNASVRDNIIFGKGVDEKRLAEAVRACALTRDLEGLVDGVYTEIGERGINLSGGQRSRIALARATYSNAEVVLLDDPLSAVDSHVSAHLVKECLLGVLKHKTRVLVTHHLEVAQHADLVLVMENGCIIQQGSFIELKNIEGHFQTLLSEYGNDTESTSSLIEADTNNIDVPAETPADAAVVPEDSKAVTKIHTDEERDKGAISGKTYAAYGKAMMKGGPVTCALVCIALSECAQVGNTLSLGFWSSSSIKGFHQGQYMGIYAGLGVAIALFTFIGAYTAALAGLGASFLMFQSALRSVLRSPTLFHDRTPSGRIVSRLTKDVERVDIFLPKQWFQLIQGTASIVGMIFLTFYSLPWLGIIFIPLFSLYYVFGTFYRYSARELKRINSTTRSFVYSGFNEQLAGAMSIRAYQEQSKFIEDISQAMNRESRFYYTSIFVGIWLTIRLDLLGSLFILAIGIFGVAFRNKIEPAKLGLLHYGQLPQEAEPVKPNDPDEHWPSQGAIDLEGVELKYRPDLPAVLKGLSVQICPGEKVGIVGRTGAGKSSCLQALFRLVELSRGQITIDGVNLADIGLDTLRKSLSAIPQEPLLYSGTIRDNLDPEGIKTDAELHDALQRCGLVDTTSGQSQRFNKFKLDAQVSDEGGNFSGGERQLVALCRALVKNRKVLMLDEATSSVDPETDATIQKTIRTEFGDVTLLATIAFYDRVLVLEKGNVAEFANPLDLFDQHDSIFRGMCDAANLDREGILKIRNQGN